MYLQNQTPKRILLSQDPRYAIENLKRDYEQSTAPLKILGYNTRSLLDQFSINNLALQNILNSLEYDVVIILETWLLNKSWITSRDYDTHQVNSETRSKGILIFTKKHLKALIPFPQLNSDTNLLIKVFNDKTHIFICGSYIAPNNKEKY